MRVSAHRLVLVVFVAFVASCGACGDNSGPKKIVPCGNGEIDPGETCDPNIDPGEEGACPTQCEQSADPCVEVVLEGFPGRCSVECVETQRECGVEDGCCPSGFCSETDDVDCGVAALCGNGSLDDGEDCDPQIATGFPGACECPQPGAQCSTVVVSGNPNDCELECTTQQITACVNNDSCCPTGCTPSNDVDCTDLCGDGVTGPTETCDGDCPTSCDDADECTLDAMTGSPATCDVDCQYTNIVACNSGDGCCPPGCDETVDTDCNDLCGNGNLDPGEECDGDCPTDCDDNMACTTDSMTGSPATCDVVCTNTDITDCIDGDGCCPSICDASNDSDCSATCGNGVVEAPELCDGNCPTSATCQPNDACETATLSGSAANCTAECVRETISQCIDNDGCCPPVCDSTNDNDCSASCGNNVVEPPELCDGNCPTAASCQPVDACQTATLVGSAANCNAECVRETIDQCIDNDGCCPTVCTFDIDNDCPCTPDTCASLGWTCGTVVDDGCGGGGEFCGTCAADQDCVSNVCEDNLGVGDACLSDGDCPTVDGVCITEADLGWTGGYCSRACVSDADCGAPNHCSPDGICLRDCTADADCRAGYGCYDTDQDAVDECGPLATGAGVVGDPCSSYADCAGGAEGWCGTEASQFKDGWCSRDCINTPCPAGTHCSTADYCVPDCTTSTDCRGNGYECYDHDNDGSDECFRWANGAGAVGDACAGMWDCAGGQWGWCVTDAQGWPGGYCTVFCAAGAASCPNGSTCYDDGQTEYCLDDCQNANQCRAGYGCSDPGNGQAACFP